MRQTSELLKVVSDEDLDENEGAADESGSGMIPTGGNQSEALVTHFQGLARPVREAELSLERLDQHLVTLHEAEPESSAQYNRLAIALITGALKNPPLKRVLIASAHHLEGRTCVMLNLAAALARAGQKVLVVDSDLLRPSVGRLLGVDVEVGIAEALTEGLRPDAAVTRLLPINFDILPARAQVENSVELLASPTFGAMLNALDPLYDFILLDSAPLLASADSSLLVLQTHATLMVVRPGTTTTAQMAKAVSQLNEDALFGVVLNRVE